MSTYLPKSDKNVILKIKIRSSNKIYYEDQIISHRLDGQITVNAHASYAEYLEFKSRTSQILHSVANGW